jgi:hypothetical protein
MKKSKNNIGFSFNQHFILVALLALVVSCNIFLLGSCSSHRTNTELPHGKESLEASGSNEASCATQEPTTTQEDLTQETTSQEEDATQEPTPNEGIDNSGILTYQNLNTVSGNKNIIWFVVDRFDVSYYEDYALKDCPEIFEHLDGFTYYNNAVSRYSRTYPSVTYMLTGMTYEFPTYHQFHIRRLEYFEKAYAAAPFLWELNKNNYNVNIYTDDIYGYSDAKHMAGYISNAGGKYPMFTSDMKNVYEFLRQNPLQLDQEKNNFSFIHIAGCHLPNLYNQDFSPVSDEERNSATSAMIQSFKIINLYLEQLKELGLYEDATIIISADHGNATPSYPLEAPHVPAIFIKESGSAGSELKTSSAPIIQGDILPTIIQSEGIKTDIDFGECKPVSEIAENEQRVRYCLFDGQNPAGPVGGELIEFEINGNANDLKNWMIKWREEFNN